MVQASGYPSSCSTSIIECDNRPARVAVREAPGWVRALRRADLVAGVCPIASCARQRAGDWTLVRPRPDNTAHGVSGHASRDARRFPPWFPAKTRFHFPDSASLSASTTYDFRARKTGVCPRKSAVRLGCNFISGKRVGYPGKGGVEVWHSLPSTLHRILNRPPFVGYPSTTRVQPSIPET